MMPSIERLHELFYVREDGALIRKARAGSARAGCLASCLDADGYLRVVVDKHRTPVHRVIFAMSRGHWPVNEIDHIDGCKTNNRPENLRDVTRSQNMQNIKTARIDNKLGLKGVKRSARDKSKFRFRIQVGNKRIAKDGFATAEAAHEAYRAAKAHMHSHAPSEYASAGVVVADFSTLEQLAARLCALSGGDWDRKYTKRGIWRKHAMTLVATANGRQAATP